MWRVYEYTNHDADQFKKETFVIFMIEKICKVPNICTVSNLHTGICHDITCMECQCSGVPSDRGILHLVWFGWVWFGGGVLLLDAVMVE
jgi:hypothetical protein